MNVPKAKVAVVGLGYVGLPLALLTIKKGYSVTGVDLDEKKVGLINKGQDPISDEYVAKNLKASKLKAVTDFSVVKDSDIVIICVPTPVKNGYQPDLRPLKSAVSSVAKHLKPETLLVIESTINPGVCDEVVIPTITKVSDLEVNEDYYLAHCPERINPGDSKWSVENIPRVVGASNKQGLRLAVKFYKSIIDAPLKAMGSLKEAEAVKIVENS